MRVLIIAFTVALFSFTSIDNREQENYLANTEWKISRHAFADINQENYTLSQVEDDWRWGCFVYFQDKTFGGRYSAPCGNDCFVSTSGNYQFTDEKTLFVDVKRITRTGFCENTGVDSVGFKAYYFIESNGNGYELNKTEKPN